MSVDGHLGQAGGVPRIADAVVLVEAAFAARRGLGVDAGDALQRVGDVVVRQLADVLGRDGVDEVVAVPLDPDRLLQRGADAGDDDLLDRVGPAASLAAWASSAKAGAAKCRDGEHAGRSDQDRPAMGHCHLPLREPASARGPVPIPSPAPTGAHGACIGPLSNRHVHCKTPFMTIKVTPSRNRNKDQKNTNMANCRLWY